MFKFLRRNKQQPQPEANHEERPTTPEQPVVDSVDHLEEVLKPLFGTVKPTVPEDYFGMYMFAKLSKVHQCFPNVSSQSIHSLSSLGYINVYHGGSRGRLGRGGGGGGQEGRKKGCQFFFWQRGVMSKNSV